MSTIKLNRGNLLITRTGEREFTVVSGRNTYHVTHTGGRTRCDCPARGMCKHLRTALSCNGLTIGGSVTVEASTDRSLDDGLLDGEQFDFEAGRDVRSELDYIRSGREKRNYGC